MLCRGQGDDGNALYANRLGPPLLNGVTLCPCLNVAGVLIGGVVMDIEPLLALMLCFVATTGSSDPFDQ